MSAAVAAFAGVGIGVAFVLVGGRVRIHWRVAW